MITQYKEGELGPGGFPISMGEALKNKPIVTSTTTSPDYNGTVSTPVGNITFPGDVNINSSSNNSNSSSTSNLPTYRADPTTGAIDYSNQLNPNYTEPTVTEPEIPTVDYQAQLAEQQAMQESINQQMLDLQNTYTQTLTDLSATIEQANAQNLDMFTAGNQALMTQVEQSARAAVAANSNTVANDDFINAAFQAFHGKNASDEELKIYSGKSIEQSLQAIKLGAPKKTPGSGLGDFTNGNITEDGLNINNNLASDIADKIPEDPINTFTEVKAPELATQTEIEMLRLMDTYRENIGQLMEQQSSIMSNMQTQITNTLEQWNIPEMVNAAWKQSDIEGSMANAQQFVNQANQLFDTVYNDTADGSIPTKVLSRANAGKFAGLQAAANLNMGYANDANNIINSHYTMMQNSITSRISAYQSVMSEAGLNMRTSMSLDANVLTNQINTLSDINSRIETKKQTILDFMATGAAKFGEAIDLDNDTDEQIANKISMANLKYGIYNTYAQQYPDTLQFMDSSMTLDELQNAINFSQIYKNSQEAIRAQSGLEAEGTIEIPNSEDTMEELNINFNGTNWSEDLDTLKEAIKTIHNNSSLSDDEKKAKIASLEQKLQELYPEQATDSAFNIVENESITEVKEEKEFVENFTIDNAIDFLNKSIGKNKLKSGEGETEKWIPDIGKAIVDVFADMASTIGRGYNWAVYRTPIWEDTEAQKIATKYENLLTQYNNGEVSDKQVMDYVLQTMGFSNVGSDTNTASTNTLATGTKGLQCGEYINKTAGILVGNNKQNKIDNVDNYGHKGADNIAIGDVIVQDIGTYGHVALVTSIDEDGNLTLSESNYYDKTKPETVTNDRKININNSSIYGYITPSEQTNSPLKLT